MPKAYEEAGVSVEAGYEVVKRIKSHVARTNRPGVVGGIGGFGGLFDLASLGYKEPVLISGTDGVGTKLVVAKMAEYDLAGFAVGVAEKSAIVDGSSIVEGDVLIGLPSTGVHSNGFSLVRKALFEQAGYTVDTQLDELGGEKLGDVLLTPTKIYVKTLSPLFKAGVVKGVAHITGGGFIENIPRMIPDGLAAHINLGSWPVLPIFDVLEKAGSIDHMEMFNIFNMGIGMVLAVSAEDADKTMELLKSNGEAGYVLGNIVKKTGEDLELQ